MIEAVNSVVSNAPLLRGPAAQTDASRAGASNSNAVSQSSNVKAEPVQAPYISPYIQVDNNYNKAVLQIRDSDTGDVIRQFPSESRLAQRAAEAQVDARIAEQAAENVSQPAPAAIESRAPQQQAKAPEKSAPAPSQAPANTGQAQIASAALSTAASSQSSSTSSGGVSVLA